MENITKPLDLKLLRKLEFLPNKRKFLEEFGSNFLFPFSPICLTNNLAVMFNNFSVQLYDDPL